jgi:RNA polymerase sigma factor (sigma-70 family)
MLRKPAREEPRVFDQTRAALSDSLEQLPQGPFLSTDQGPEEFRALCERARAGEVDACAELYRLFSPFARRLIGQYMHPLLRKLYDTDDLLQDVWQAFFLKILPGRNFESPEQVLKLLWAVTRNLTLKLYRYRVETKKRDLSREVPLQLSELSQRGRDGEEPSRRLTAQDELDFRLSRLSERDRAVVSALLEGDLLAEAATRCSVSVATVRRILTRCRHKLDLEIEPFL